jgi:hypothetical protein
MKSHYPRRSKQECLNCHYWSGESHGQKAECRRRAPDPAWLGTWPLTESFDWCGEWAPLDWLDEWPPQEVPQ